MRRAAVPIAFSQGFTPHPKISYASAAPTGVASEAEYLEIGLQAQVDPAEVRRRPGRGPVARPGRARRGEAGAGTSLADRIDASALADRAAGHRARRSLEQAVEAFRAADEVLVERMTKQGRRTFDARGAVALIEVITGEYGTFRGRRRCRVRYLTLSYGRSRPPYDPMTSSPASAWWPAWSRRCPHGRPGWPRAG